MNCLLICATYFRLFSSWTDGLTVKNAEAHAKTNETTISTLLDLVKQYNKRLEEENDKTPEELLISNVGKIDPKKHLEHHIEELMTNNISQTLGIMIDTVVF
jgi:26S proteasome regulatory subunit N11